METRKYYSVIEVSSGEVPAELDRIEVYPTYIEAKNRLKKLFQNGLKEYREYGEVTYTIDNDEYEITLEDNNGDITTFAGYISDVMIPVEV